MYLSGHVSKVSIQLNVKKAPIFNAKLRSKHGRTTGGARGTAPRPRDYLEGPAPWVME